MTPLARLTVCLIGVAVAGALAWVATAWFVDAATPPTVARLQPQPPMRQAERTPPVAAAAALPVAAAPVPAMPASEPLRSQPPDASRMQREIQLALHSAERGAARKALKYLHDCWAVRQVGDRQRAALDAGRHRMSEAAYSEALSQFEERQRGCQAIDANSRGQWEPLLRRSLAEGDEGVSTRLVLALGERFDPAAEPAIVAGLLRDAWACDGLAFVMLRPLARKHSPLIGPHVAGAVNALDRAQLTAYVKKNPAGNAEVDRQLAELVTPADADPAEVARLVSDMRTRCPD